MKRGKCQDRSVLTISLKIGIKPCLPVLVVFEFSIFIATTAIAVGAEGKAISCNSLWFDTSLKLHNVLITHPHTNTHKHNAEYDKTECSVCEQF